MKTKFDIKSVFSGALLGAALVLALGAATNQSRTAWEYSVEWITLNQGNTSASAIQLESINKQGWELVSAQMFPVAGQEYQHGPTMVLRRRAKPPKE